MKIDVDAVRETGKNRFSAVAETFMTAASRSDDVRGEAASAMPATIIPDSSRSLLISWTSYMDQIQLYFTTSADHLEACGEILVDMANELDWTDEENSYNIRDSFESSLAQARNS